ncbi:MAG: cation:proton antiporter [Proteobacteria bacterium]|nr:cation:proton antiporter [Pseudomonadota bacterium]
MNDFNVIELVGTIVTLLLIAVGIAALTKRVKLPFTVALVLVGILLRQLTDHGPEFLGQFITHEISPNVIMFVFLPTLLFESAFNLDVRQLRSNLLAVLVLAIPGLLLSTGIIGVMVWLLTPFDLASSLLLGSILSATDPVAVIAIFRHLGVPERLTILVEGESLLNDATAIVIARILMGVVAGGVLLTPETALASVAGFFTVFVGGAVVGWLAALIFGTVLGRVESDTFIETSLTTILAYMSFFIAEELLHVSGVMATVAAGLTMGSWGRAKISGSVADYIEHFWEYIAGLCNALIFLMVGLRVELAALYDSLHILVWVIAAMLLARAVVIFGLVPLVGLLPKSAPVSRGYQAVMYWGGLRGAIALAIVLSLTDFEYADLFVAIVMGSVLFTLLVQGLTIEALVHRLGLDKPPLAYRVGRAEGLLNAKRRALERIPDLQGGGLFSAPIAERLEQRLGLEIKGLRDDLENLRHRELESIEERQLLFNRAFAAEKTIYYELFTKGQLSERAYRDLCHAVGLEADAMRQGLPMPADPLHFQQDRALRVAFLRLFDKAFGFTGLPERLRLAHVAREYEESWGRYQGCARILDEMETLVLAASAPSGIVAEVIKRYRAWKDTAEQQIDATAEQFPEFVNAMQERLANRLLVHAETEIIEKEARAGSIPGGVRDTVLAELAGEIRDLQGADVARLRIDPMELLRKVPFFGDTSRDEFLRVADKLRQRTVAAGEAVIRQGEQGDSLFLIARGVIRVSRSGEGGEHDLATLIAGDFFGEMALLHREPRTATCRSVTPAALYELRRRDLNDVIGVCPGLKTALEEADRERRRLLAEHDREQGPGGV